MKWDWILMVLAYSIDIAFALAGRSTLWNWSPKDILFHHTAGIVFVSVIFLYDWWMSRKNPSRPTNKMLRSISVYTISSLLSGFNEGTYAVLAVLPRPPGSMARGIQRGMTVFTLFHYVFTNVFVYYTSFLERFLRRDHSLEFGEVLLFQGLVGFLALHLNYLNANWKIF